MIETVIGKNIDNNMKEEDLLHIDYRSTANAYKITYDDYSYGNKTCIVIAKGFGEAEDIFYTDLNIKREILSIEKIDSEYVGYRKE